MPAPLAPALLALSLAATPAEPPGDWTAELRGGLAQIVLDRPGGAPRGGVFEVSAGRVLYERVVVELSTGTWRLDVAALRSRFSVVPITASVRIFGPVDLGFHPYLMAGGGLHLVSITVDEGPAQGTLHDHQRAWGFHAGLGVTRPFGDWLWAGGDVRYQFLSAPSDLLIGGPAGICQGTALSCIRLDSLRVTVSLGARF